MATIKLKKPGAPAADRPPVRGPGNGAKGARPTLAQAQAQRAEREARYQEQLRQRFGAQPPEAFKRGGPPPAEGRGAPAQRADRGAPVQRGDRPAFDPRRDQRPPPPGGPRGNPASPRPGRGGPPPETDRRHARPPEPNGRTDRTFDDASRRDPRAAPAQRPPNTAFGPRRDSAPRHDAPRDTRPPASRLPSARQRSRDRDDDDDDDFQPAAHAPGSLRLSKRMSELGIASRREADEWIAKGYVRVDDVVVSELGSRVLPQQRITIDAKAKFQQAQRVTVLVNKPVGYVSGQAEDGYEPAMVLVTPQNQWHEDRSGTRFLREHLKSLVPAGRLDIDSVGLLVLTQDGRVAKQLIGEDSEIDKEYLVRVATADGRRLPESGLELLRHGLELDGEPLRPAQVEWVNEDQLRFVLTQGKKRQIRRMCEAVGLQVLGLKRVRIGRVMLGDLPAGQWRYLRADEAFA